MILRDIIIKSDWNNIIIVDDKKNDIIFMGDKYFIDLDLSLDNEVLYFTIQENQNKLYIRIHIIFDE